MNLAKLALEKKAVSYFATVLLIVAGITSFFSLGQLEDPEFSIKTAVIATQYQGASAAEVELEVTDRLEVALQQLKSVDYIKSFSAPGYSQIWVNIKPEYWATQLPQVWDEMRRKVREVENALPPGVQRPVINDDFGDVYGLLMAITGDGFSYAEMESAAKDLKKELSLVPGVARVELWGVQPKAIYLEASESQLSQFGLSDQSLINTLQQQNLVVDGGSINLQNQRARLAPTGEFHSPADIGDLAIHPSLLDSLQNLDLGSPFERSNELIRVRDLATVRRGYVEPPSTLLRLNGRPAIAIAVTNVSGANIVDVGRAVDARMQELEKNLPIGLDVHHVHWMSDVVDTSVKGFFVNLAEAVVIVLLVLALSMGWRLGVIIGADLVLTILGTFIVMSMLGIDLQRTSLGALVVALGMMVDNSIVVADGFLVRLQQGMERRQAAIEAAGGPAMPLLGATIVAVMAFYPIGGSKENTGEYCLSLFLVVGISLLLSWVIAMTLTPLKCVDMLPDPKPDAIGQSAHSGRMFRVFGDFLGLVMRRRFLFVAGMSALLVLAIIGFGGVKQLFFPDSSMSKFMIDFYAPQGTRIEAVSADLQRLENRLLQDDRVENVAAFIGAGPPRFYLPVEPESANPSYGQLIVNLKDYHQIDGLIEELSPRARDAFPNALVPMRKYGVGPSQTWKFQFRISGPALADTEILRGLAERVQDVLRQEPLVGSMQTDWRQKVPVLVPVFNQARARWAGVERGDVANATKRAFDGRTIGLYRENDELLPIILRHTEDDRKNIASLDVIQVQPQLSTATLPLAQVTDGIRFEWEETRIFRRDRRRTITVQANPIQGVTLPTVLARVQDKVEALPMPTGYTFAWGGEPEEQAKSQKALLPGIIPSATIILFIIVALFNAFRPPLVILLTIPFAVVGITAGLLVFNAPFGFMALLGAMSLSGMMIKNAIVLLDEVNVLLQAGKSPYDAVIGAAVIRLRPVLLAAGTTVLGVVPLLQDPFWVGMAVTIMAGLTFGTILTMVLVPVFYAILYKIPVPGRS